MKKILDKSIHIVWPFDKTMDIRMSMAISWWKVNLPSCGISKNSGLFFIKKAFFVHFYQTYAYLSLIVGTDL